MEQVKQFLYPAVFVKGDNQIIVSFPDIGITTEGDTFEEAFLFAKDYLKSFCTYAEKFNLEIEAPSFFEDTSKNNCLDTTMLIDTILFPSDVK